MITKKVPTFWANIYVGFKETYSGPVHSFEEAKAVCRAYCDEIGLGLSITQTTFVYTNGEEPGCLVSLIHYPRFPDDNPEKQITERALTLAERLLVALGQLRVSVVTPGETIMITSPHAPND